MGMDENAQNAALREYMANGGVNLDPAVTAWCAGAANAAIQAAGGKGTGSNMARSFLDYGQPVTDPQKGDIAVFSRGNPSGQEGHVGFFDGYNPDGTIRVLGGNQGDKVSIASYDPSRLLGFRRDAAQTNALQPQQMQPQSMPQFRIAQANPADFMVQRNALSRIPLQYQRTNALGRL
jgi:uncharacterized protein (TIGR02594 family)